MSEFQDSTTQAAAPRWVGLAIAALGATSLLGIGIGWSALNQGKQTEQNVQASVKQQNDALMQRLAKSDDQNQQLQSDLKVVTDKLNVTQEELDRARKQFKASVVAYNKKLSDVNTQLGTKANVDDVNKLSGDVSGVKNDLDETKGKLDRATGDMGVMSGLIATNHDELEILKHKGDRNYLEFTLQKGAKPTLLSTIKLQLKKADEKHSKYTLNVSADDRNIEKKDKGLDEPVQFYTGKDPVLFELVVNVIEKNKVSGYLSTPKNVASAATATP